MQSFEPSPKDIEHFTGNQKLVFLEAVQQQGDLSADRAQLLGKVYDLESSQKPEEFMMYIISSRRSARLLLLFQCLLKRFCKRVKQ